jgi:hypothetical protein
VYWFPPKNKISNAQMIKKLTNNFLVCSWMINIIVPSRHWILNMLSNGHHPILCFVHLMVLVHAACAVAILLGHLHALLLHGIHGFHCVFLFALEHPLEGLLLGDGVQRDVGVNTVVVFFLMGEHFEK